MMPPKKLFEEIQENMQTVLEQDSPLAKLLWDEFMQVHPADIAQFLSELERDQFHALFLMLPAALKADVFEHLSEPMRAQSLSMLAPHEKAEILDSLSIDELTDLFDFFSDDELKMYIGLLHRKNREKVVSLLKFSPDSAGGIMDTEVLYLVDTFTVAKSIQILQRLQPRQELHQQIYVTDKDGTLLGHIRLEDLVLQRPGSKISDFLRKNELVAFVNDDQEAVAKKMVHYHLMSVPVVGDNNYFLGVIPTNTLVDILEEEATEDVYRMAAVKPIKYTYLETPFWRLFYDRTTILIGLLLIESFSSTIISAHEATLGILLVSFIPMLTSAGGNSSNQTSALVIQGMAAGEIGRANVRRLLKREFAMAMLIGGVLGICSFMRVFYACGSLRTSAVVSLSLAMIVVVSIMLGSFIPFGLKRLHIDPAFSAGPFLATIMDIMGVFIFCFISSKILV